VTKDTSEVREMLRQHGYEEGMRVTDEWF
jgi:hypothetical protein